MVAFEPEPFDNEGLIPIPCLSSILAGIHYYITVPVLNRRKQDIIFIKSSSVNNKSTITQ